MDCCVVVLNTFKPLCDDVVGMKTQQHSRRKINVSPERISTGCFRSFFPSSNLFVLTMEDHQGTHMHAYTHVHIRIHTDTYIHLYTHMYTHTHTHKCIHTHAHMNMERKRERPTRQCSCHCISSLEMRAHPDSETKIDKPFVDTERRLLG